MLDSRDNTSIGLPRETASHAQMLERLARLDDLEFYLLNLHLVYENQTLDALHEHKSSTSS
jgi:hypothetical protein